MADTARTVVERQVRRARRRLVAQIFLENLLLSGAVALLLAGVWFLIRPFAFASLGEDALWQVPAGLLAIAAVAACVRTWLQAPGRIAAALEIDERFLLRERVTTVLTLTPAQLASPAGQALLDDVKARVGGLHIAERFPLILRRRTGLAPVGALAIAAAAFCLEPYLSSLHIGLPSAQAKSVYDTREIQQELDNLRKTTAPAATQAEPKTEELKELESEWDKLINKNLDLNDQEKVRERVNELRRLEDKLKDRLESVKEKTEKGDILRRELEKLAAGDKKLQDGPAKDFHDALAKGELAKAQDILDKLEKELKGDKLSKEQQKQLADQFKQIQDKMQQLMEENELLKQLEKNVAEGKIDQEVLDRALEQFKELQDLSSVMGDLAKCLGDGNGDKACDALGRAIRQLRDMGLSDAELKKLLKCDKDLDEAMKLLLKAMQGNNLNGKGGMPGAERPIDPNDPETNAKNERQKAHVDPKGEQRITGFVRGGSFTKIPARAVDGAFQQAVQEAPEAIDRQRIPDDAADIARGYFKKLGNQKD